MVKKLQKSADDTLAAAAGLLDSQLAQTVKDSAQQIWLAGLGAFAKAQGNGGKVFETLMKEGVHLQRQTQAAAGEKINEKLGDMAGKMSAMAGEVGQKANAQWDKLESIFEERTARALGRLGVPSAKQLAALSARVDALAAELARLAGASSAVAPALKRKAAKGASAGAAASPPPAARRRKAAPAAPQATAAPTAAPTAPPAKAGKATRAVKAAPAVRTAAVPRKRAA